MRSHTASRRASLTVLILALLLSGQTFLMDAEARSPRSQKGKSTTTTSTIAPTTPTTLAPTNNPPDARISPAQTVAVGSPADVWSTTSSDPDGDPITLRWAQNGGPSVSLTVIDPTHVRFTPNEAGTYVIEVTVTDDKGASSSKETTVTASSTSPEPSDEPSTSTAGGDVNTPTAESRLAQDANVLWMWTMDHPDGARATVGSGFDENYTQTISTVRSPAPSGGQDNGNVLKIRFPNSESGVQHDQYTGYGLAMRRRFSALNLTPQRRLFLRYSMYIPADFNPYNGGKILSLQSHPENRAVYGSDGVSSANVYHDDSWWAGMMWTGPSEMTGTWPNRTYTDDANLDHIRIQPYVYAKQINGVTMTKESVAGGQRGWHPKLRAGLNQDPNSSPTSSGTGSGGFIYLNRGRWNTVEQEVVLNDAGVANGHLRMWVNGVLGLNVKNVKWAGDTYNGTANINGIHVDTFFGGPSSNASSQVLYYDDVVLSKSYIGPRGG